MKKIKYILIEYYKNKIKFPLYTNIKEYKSGKGRMYYKNFDENLQKNMIRLSSYINRLQKLLKEFIGDVNAK